MNSLSRIMFFQRQNSFRNVQKVIIQKLWYVCGLDEMKKILLIKFSVPIKELNQTQIVISWKSSFQSDSVRREIKSTLQKISKLSFRFHIGVQEGRYLFIVGSEMNPLATNQRVLTWLCICPFDRDTRIWQKTLCVILTLFLFTFIFSLLVSSIVFFVQNVSIDFESCLYAVFQIAGISGLIDEWSVAFILRKRVHLLFGSLAKIYEESESDRMKKRFKHWTFFNKLNLFI